MAARRQYEIVFDRFHKRWAFKPQGLPGALQVGRTRDQVIELAIPICSNQYCTLRIHSEDGTFDEERQFGKETFGSRR